MWWCPICGQGVLAGCDEYCDDCKIELAGAPITKPKEVTPQSGRAQAIIESENHPVLRRDLAVSRAAKSVRSQLPPQKAEINVGECDVCGKQIYEDYYYGRVFIEISNGLWDGPNYSLDTYIHVFCGPCFENLGDNWRQFKKKENEDG